MKKLSTVHIITVMDIVEMVRFKQTEFSQQIKILKSYLKFY